MSKKIKLKRKVGSIATIDGGDITCEIIEVLENGYLTTLGHFTEDQLECPIDTVAKLFTTILNDIDKMNRGELDMEEVHILTQKVERLNLLKVGHQAIIIETGFFCKILDIKGPNILTTAGSFHKSQLESLFSRMQKIACTERIIDNLEREFKSDPAQSVKKGGKANG